MTTAEDTRQSPKLQLAWNAIGFSLSSSGLLGALAYAVGFPFREIPVPMGLALAFGFGAIVGGLCSPLIVINTWKRDFTIAKPVILSSTAIAVVPLAVVLSEDRLLHLMWLAGTAFVATSFVTRFTFPRIWDDPGLCRRCGYDLTGNTSGACPECGLGLIDELSPLKRLERKALVDARARMLSFLLRHPEGPVVVLIVVLITLAAVCQARRYARTHRITAAVERAAGEAGSIDFATDAGFDWDRLYVFPPYTTRSGIEQSLTFSWRELQDSFLVGEEGHLLVFVRQRTVVEHLSVQWHFETSCCGRPIPRDQAVFAVRTSGANKVPVVRLQRPGGG